MKTVLVAGVPHVPFLTSRPGLGDKTQVDGLLASFNKVKQNILEFDPQVVLVISAEHINKFFLENVPAFCVGVSPEFDGPSDTSAALPQVNIPGAELFAESLIRQGYADGFDLSFSRKWSLDHGFMIPLHLLTDYQYPIVPIFVNAAIPPHPTIKRCLEVGKLIRKAIANYDHAERFLVIGAGGISHSVGGFDMGKIDEAFDRKFLQILETGDEDQLLSLSAEEIQSAGNSTIEILAWAIAAGVVFPQKAITEFYEPIKGFATGCAVSIWPEIHIR